VGVNVGKDCFFCNVVFDRYCIGEFGWVNVGKLLWNKFLFVVVVGFLLKYFGEFD
jgi:hypothetical protein